MIWSIFSSGIVIDLLIFIAYPSSYASIHPDLSLSISSNYFRRVSTSEGGNILTKIFKATDLSLEVFLKVFKFSMHSSSRTSQS